MKAWKKIAIGVAVLVVLTLIIGFTVRQSSKNVATVQTGKAQHQDLSTIVSASGEIKPKTYVNIGANAFGKITHLYVKEGDHVRSFSVPLARVMELGPKMLSTRHLGAS